MFTAHARVGAQVPKGAPACYSPGARIHLSRPAGIVRYCPDNTKPLDSGCLSGHDRIFDDHAPARAWSFTFVRVYRLSGLRGDSRTGTVTTCLLCDVRTPNWEGLNPPPTRDSHGQPPSPKLPFHGERTRAPCVPVGYFPRAYEAQGTAPRLTPYVTIASARRLSIRAVFTCHHTSDRSSPQSRGRLDDGRRPVVVERIARTREDG